MSEYKVPERKDVPEKYKWDLTSLFKDREEWEQTLNEFEKQKESFVRFKGTLRSGKDLYQALEAYEKILKTGERLGNYAFLMQTADLGDSESKELYSRYIISATDFETKSSFFVPEITALDDSLVEEFYRLDKDRLYSVYVEKLLRMKPYILSEKEERIISLFSTSLQTPNNTFSVLTNVDMDFGEVKTKEGKIPLTQSSWSSFMQNPDRKIREEAYRQFYGCFEKNKNTLGELYSGSVNSDVAEAKIRGYGSSLEMALYKDKVPVEVYKNFISAVHKGFPVLHRYYEVMKKVLGVKELRHYDVYMPMVQLENSRKTSYEEAVEIIRKALSPLGQDYTDVLCKGLLNGWVDRYENKGKRSGAFSSGAYTGYPYILLNYKDDLIRDIFTLAHEGGHSMHSYYSAKNNPFMHYDYTIFEAEVASTVNEELLFRYLWENPASRTEEAWLLSTRLGDIVATLFRQTMFAEYEMLTHQILEEGRPLTLEVLRNTYMTLLRDYFGPAMEFEPESDLEGLRIPHFYRAFYVYKYATGISAALDISSSILSGDKEKLDGYFNFLKSGGSRYPLESLKLAGVDLSASGPIDNAVKIFESLLEKFEKIVLEINK